MILNGNYSWLDFESLKPKLTDVYTEYYGEEHRDTVASRVSSIKYVPFHTFEYVNEYYKRYIMRYRDEILDNFFAVTKMKRNSTREDILIPSDADSLDESELLTLADPTFFYIENGGLSQETFMRLEEMKKRVCNSFRIPQKEGNVDTKILKLRNILIGAIRQTESAHPCDIFTDMATLDANYDKAYRELLTYAEKQGFLFSKNDRKIIENSTNLSLDKDRLDSDGVFFLGDISVPGVLEAFTSVADAILKKSKAKDDERYLIYFKRLKYMRMCGIDFTHIQNEDFDCLNPAILTNEMKRALEAEYNHQIKTGLAPTIPPQFADIVEVKRKGIVELLYDNCKFDENLKPSKPFGYFHDSDSSTQYFMMPDNRRGKISRTGRYIYFCEDENITPDSRLNNMLHEGNHAVSNHLLVQSYTSGEERTGLEVQNIGIFGNDIVGATDFDPKIRAIMENANEKQTRELVEIFLKKYGNILPVSDIQVPQQEFVALYRYSDFLTQEFYSLFHDNIKRFNIDPSYDIYFKKTITDSPFGKLAGHISRKFERKFRPLEYIGPTGILDYEKVRSLGYLLDRYILVV